MIFTLLFLITNKNITCTELIRKQTSTKNALIYVDRHHSNLTQKNKCCSVCKRGDNLWINIEAVNRYAQRLEQKDVKITISLRWLAKNAQETYTSLSVRKQTNTSINLSVYVSACLSAFACLSVIRTIHRVFKTKYLYEY